VPQIDEAALRRLKETDPEKYQRALELTAKLPEIAERNPLTNFHPHPKQSVFLGSQDPIKAFLGGNRSGKTTAGIVDDLIQACDEESLPEALKPFKKWKPPFRCRIVTPDFTSTMEGVVFEKLREWAPRFDLLGDSWDSAYDKQRRRLRFKNGSWFDFMTFEQDLDKFGGAALNRVHYDEEPPEQIRKECRMRLIDHGGDELFTMTPLQGMSWMFDGVWERRDEPGVTCVQVDMDDNPHLDPGAKEAVLQGLTDEERKARKEGIFVHFAGLVYPEFNVERHVVPRPQKSHIQGQAIVEAIDPGLNFAGVVWVAFDKENRALAFEEIFLKDTPSLEYLAQAIKHKRAEWGISPDYSVIDPSARNRAVTIEADRIEAELQRFGIFCIHGQNDQEAGAFQIKRRLQAEPEPALLIAQNLRECIHELKRARIKETEDGSFKLLKEASPNARNEVIDALRYGLMSRPWAFVPQRDAPSNRGWKPDWAPPYEWFEDRRGRTAPPMGSFT
jgi:phage terminase large subunit-like protein